MSATLPDRLRDEADQCRNDGANDIAKLLDEAASALAARQHAQAPEGWRLAPPEATQAMHDAYSRVLSVGSELDGAMVWAAMLAAAPQPEPSCIYPACHHNGCTEQCKKQPEQAAQQSERERFEAAMLARPGFTTEEEIAAKHSGFYLYHRLGHAEIGWQAARADLLARLEAVPVPEHPEPWAWRWSDSEQRAISDYRAAMLAAAGKDTK